MNKNKYHYGWLIVLTGTFIMFSCLGLARFAYSMLLPSMGDALHLTYDQMGYIGTVNFAGYLLVISLLPKLTGRLGSRMTISIGLSVIALTMILIGLSNSYKQIIFLYFLTGIGSGLTTVPTLLLASQWFAETSRGMATGTIQIGNGLGIIFSGLAVPFLNTTFGAKGWRIGWVTFGIISIAILIAAAIIIRDQPEDIGLKPVGEQETTPIEKSLPPPDSSIRTTFIILGILYFIFGLTYPIYGTFIVTSIVDELKMAESIAGKLWAWIGVLSIFSGVIFGKLSDRIGRKKGIMVVFLLHTVAYSMVSFTMSRWALFSSIILYGLSIWSIPTIMAAAAGDYMGPERAIKGFSFVTIFLAVGQMLGPGLGGIVASSTGSFTHSYMIAAAATSIAALLTGFLREPGRN